MWDGFRSPLAILESSKLVLSGSDSQVVNFLQGQDLEALEVTGQGSHVVHRLLIVPFVGGNLNYAFVVREKIEKKHAVFVKQAPDYIKVRMVLGIVPTQEYTKLPIFFILGFGWTASLPLSWLGPPVFPQVIGPAAQLTRERMRLEVQVFQEWTKQGWDSCGLEAPSYTSWLGLETQGKPTNSTNWQGSTYQSFRCLVKVRMVRWVDVLFSQEWLAWRLHLSDVKAGTKATILPDTFRGFSSYLACACQPNIEKLRNQTSLHLLPPHVAAVVFDLWAFCAAFCSEVRWSCNGIHHGIPGFVSTASA